MKIRLEDVKKRKQEALNLEKDSSLPIDKDEKDSLEFHIQEEFNNVDNRCID